MDKTRKPDIELVEKGIKSNDPNMRMVAMNAGNEIRKQSFDSRLKRRRQDLLHKIRQGNKGNVRDIQNSMIGGMKTSMSISAKDHERIFGK